MNLVREKILGIDEPCCKEGQNSYSDLEHAHMLQGQSGFEEITDNVVAYRENRCQVADRCEFSKTGRCALEAAGMVNTFPR